MEDDKVLLGRAESVSGGRGRGGHLTDVDLDQGL